jgi:sec-independent protein translocase protein TatA
MENTVALAFIGNLGPMEWVIILIIVLLLFGARKLPELAQSMGSSIQAFKRGMKDAADAPPATPEVKPDDPTKH